MKLYTDKKYANQTLILPYVGQVTLDGEASLDVKGDLYINDLIAATATSLAFVKDPLDLRKKVTLKESLTQAEAKPRVTGRSAKEIFLSLVQEEGIQKIQDWLDELPRPKPAEDAIAKAKELLQPQAPTAPEVINGPTSEKKEEDEKDETKTDTDEPIDVDMFLEAIEDEDTGEGELRELALLVPGVKAKAIKKLTVPELRVFLTGKVKEAGAAK